MEKTEKKPTKDIEQLYQEYIGNGQFGIDFEKKHILEFAEAFHKKKQGETSIDALDFVYQWFYKLSTGQASYGEVADAIEQFHKEKLREELKLFNDWMCSKQYDGLIPTIEQCINDYLKSKK